MAFPTPVKTLYFRCGGCKTQWIHYVDPPITSAQDLDTYMKAGKSGSCPKGCGATTCDVILCIAKDPSKPTLRPDDPFKLFEKDPKKP